MISSVTKSGGAPIDIRLAANDYLWAPRHLEAICARDGARADPIALGIALASRGPLFYERCGGQTLDGKPVT